eukprot:539820_1
MNQNTISDAEVDLLAASIIEDLDINANVSISSLKSTNKTLSYASIATGIKIESNIKHVSDEKEHIEHISDSYQYFVLVTNVPYNATYEDIISFFKPVPILNPYTTGIFFVENYQGKSIGNVFVVFDNKTNYEAAFEKNGNYIGNRYIQILATNINEFNKSIRIYHGINMKHIANKNENKCNIIIKLKGFSFDIEECAIYKWLHSKLIIPKEIYIIFDFRNRNSGIAYLEFNNRKDANATFQFNNEYLGNRYINVFRSSLNELKLSLAEMCGTSIHRINFNPYLRCLRIENMPPNCKYKDIISFFSDTIYICPKQLYIQKNIAYAEFNSTFDCQMALTRHQTYLNNSLIRLTQVSTFELRHAMCDNNDNINDGNFSAEFKNYYDNTKSNKENVNINQYNNVINSRNVRK